MILLEPHHINNKHSAGYDYSIINTELFLSPRTLSQIVVNSELPPLPADVVVTVVPLLVCPALPRAVQGGSAGARAGAALSLPHQPLLQGPGHPADGAEPLADGAAGGGGGQAGGRDHPAAGGRDPRLWSRQQRHPQTFPRVCSSRGRRVEPLL